MSPWNKKVFDSFLSQSDKLFSDELRTDENKDYRRGYYAGRLHAALVLKGFLDKEPEGLAVMKMEFTE